MIQNQTIQFGMKKKNQFFRASELKSTSHCEAAFVMGPGVKFVLTINRGSAGDIFFVSTLISSLGWESLPGFHTGNDNGSGVVR